MAMRTWETTRSFEVAKTRPEAMFFGFEWARGICFFHESNAFRGLKVASGALLVGGALGELSFELGHSVQQLRHPLQAGHDPKLLPVRASGKS